LAQQIEERVEPLPRVARDADLVEVDEHGRRARLLAQAAGGAHHQAGLAALGWAEDLAKLVLLGQEIEKLVVDRAGSVHIGRAYDAPNPEAKARRRHAHPSSKALARTR
jgi:hypothetical protein